MGELVKGVFTAPIATLFIIGGMLFLLVAVLGNISGKIEPGLKARIISGVFGLAFILVGVSIHVMQSGLNPLASSTVSPISTKSNQSVVTPQSLTLFSSNTVFQDTIGTRGTVGPSFDCRKAQYDSERMICSSAELSSLDVQMADAFRSAAARLTTEQHFEQRNAQSYWLRQVRDRCRSEACLAEKYRKRIQELEAYYR
jgi:uncharacterized protein YecT (DUF1311 family)